MCAIAALNYPVGPPRRGPTPELAECLRINWTAKGGTVTEGSTFTAGDTEGLSVVQVTAEGLEAITEVRIAKDEPPPPPLPGKQVIRRSGDVPPQK